VPADYTRYMNQACIYMRKVGEAVKDGWQPIAAEAQNLRMAQVDFRFLLPEEVDALVDEAGSLYDRIMAHDPADHSCDYFFQPLSRSVARLPSACCGQEGPVKLEASHLAYSAATCAAEYVLR
jgi:hypothetical protein